MKRAVGMLLAVAAGLGGAVAEAQPGPTRADQIRAHKIEARRIAGADFTGALARLCTVPDTMMPRAAPAGGPAIPDRASWYAEPYKVFDDLYWVGTKVHSAWALTTRDGIILIDTVYNYAAETAIVGGLKKLGLDPASVKYVVISHGHGDHDEGARLFQERYGAHVVMSAEDWELVAGQTGMPGGQPKRDVVAKDGDRVTLGGAEVRLVQTPGHTLGTLSMVFTVHDKGRPIAVAYSGGTAFNFPPSKVRFDSYIASQRRLARAAAEAGATVLLSNHSEFDRAYDLARVSQLPRAPGEPSPFVIGADAVGRYFAVTAACAESAKLETGVP